MAVSHRNKAYPMGWRHVITLNAAFGMFVVYSLRVNLSVAIVSMVNHTALNLQENVSIKDAGQKSICEDASSNKTIPDGKFFWNAYLQGYILSSFFYGYILTHIIGGQFAGRYGAKWVFGLGTVFTSILTLFSELAVDAHFIAFFALRVLEGICEGVTWPAIQSLFSRWAHPSERSTLVAFAYSGSFLGTPFTYVVSGIMMDANFLGGWPSCFYVFGLIGCVWFVFWVIFTSSSPQTHRWISKAEKDYIVGGIEKDETYGKIKPGFCDVPWRAILSSSAVWATFLSHFSYAWSLYVLLTALPTYFQKVLGFDIKDNGWFSALPYICQAIVHASSGRLADYLQKKFQLRTVTVRKLFDSLGHLLPGIFIIAVGYVNCDKTLAITLMILSVGCSGFCGAGFLVSYLDIAPQYAGVLFGVSNTFGTFAGMIGPLVTYALSKDNSQESWQIVFCLAGAIYFLSVIVFGIFAQGSVQPWAEPNQRYDESRLAMLKKSEAKSNLPSDKRAILAPKFEQSERLMVVLESTQDVPPPPEETTSMNTSITKTEKE